MLQWVRSFDCGTGNGEVNSIGLKFFDLRILLLISTGTIASTIHMFHKHASAHAHTCLYTSGQRKRAKMTTNRKIVLKLKALYYKRKKIDKYRQHLFGKNRDIDTFRYS